MEGFKQNISFSREIKSESGDLKSDIKGNTPITQRIQNTVNFVFFDK